MVQLKNASLFPWADIQPVWLRNPVQHPHPPVDPEQLCCQVPAAFYFPDHPLVVRPLDFTAGSWSFEQLALSVFQIFFQFGGKVLEQQEGVPGERDGRTGTDGLGTDIASFSEPGG